MGIISYGHIIFQAKKHPDGRTYFYETTGTYHTEKPCFPRNVETDIKR